MRSKWMIPALALVFIAGGVAYFSARSPKNVEVYEGTELNGAAPDFELRDQNGTIVSLSDFRGKIAVLTFMDSQCTDTCPLTAVHFRETYKQLDQNEARQVVFLGVNVNVEASSVAEVLEITRAWHLDEIPNWHFLTGSRDTLVPVWQEYGVSADHSPNGHSIMHTPGTFLIDRLGQQRWYISTPFFADDEASLTPPLNELLLKRIRELLLENDGS
jgi:protein SCO1/2